MTCLITVASALVAAVLSALPAAAETYAVRFQNNSDATVRALHSSPGSNASWERDLLGSTVLPPGAGLDVIIHNVSECRYDVLVEFDTGYSFTDSWDICAYGQYNIN